jgi:hypothetical protein
MPSAVAKMFLRLATLTSRDTHRGGLLWVLSPCKHRLGRQLNGRRLNSSAPAVFRRSRELYSGALQLAPDHPQDFYVGDAPPAWRVRPGTTSRPRRADDLSPRAGEGSGGRTAAEVRADHRRAVKAFGSQVIRAAVSRPAPARSSSMRPRSPNISGPDNARHRCQQDIASGLPPQVPAGHR